LASAGYKVYVSPKWLYSLEYPADWYDIPNGGVPDIVKYFSNEAVGSVQLDSIGILASVFVDPQPTRPCATGPAPSPGAKDISVLEVSIDGTRTMAYLSPGGVEGPYVMHANWCYHFSFMTRGTQDRELHMAEVKHILSSFRFNR
jgi:hypothetical protein